MWKLIISILVSSLLSSLTTAIPTPNEIIPRELVERDCNPSGLNCKGSAMCYKAGVLAYWQSSIDALSDLDLFSNGEHIVKFSDGTYPSLCPSSGCTDGFALFVQCAPTDELVTGATIKAQFAILVGQGGCDTCGSVGLKYPTIPNSSVGILTSNYVTRI